MLDEELLLVLEPQAWSNQIQGAAGWVQWAQLAGPRSLAGQGSRREMPVLVCVHGGGRH